MSVVTGRQRPQTVKNGADPYGQVIWPSLRFGGFAGISGLLLGGINGLRKSNHPGFYTLASGIQYFGVGTTFFLIRNSIFASQLFDHNPMNSWTRSHVSGVAGACTATLLCSVYRQYRLALRFAPLGGAAAWIGQHVFCIIDDLHTQHMLSKQRRLAYGKPEPLSWFKVIDSIAAMKYSPINRLSDRSFEEKLEEQLTAVEADIALIDDKIEEVKREDQIAKEKAQTAKTDP